MGETAFLLLLSFFSFLFFFTFQIFQSLKVILSTVNTGSRAPNGRYQAPAFRNYDYFILKKKNSLFENINANFQMAIN